MKKIFCVFLSISFIFICILSADAKRRKNDFSFENIIVEQNIEALKTYLENTPPKIIQEEINKENSFGLTPLLFAVEENNFEMVKLLILYGADINLKIREKIPFVVAIKNSNKEIIEYLISLEKLNKESYDEALLEIAGPFINPQLCQNCQQRLKEVNNSDDIEFFKRLVSKGASIKDNENYLLLRATVNGNIKIIKYLIESGVNPDIKESNYESSALFDAVRMKNKKVIEVLLENGADINTTNCAGVTPVFITISNDGDITEKKENFEMLKFLVEHGANINICAIDGETPLSEACRIWNFQIIKYLIEKGADINAYNVLPFAVERKGTEILSYIISKGANIKSENGGNALIAAINANNKQAINILKKNGADIKKANIAKAKKYQRFNEVFADSNIE